MKRRGCGHRSHRLKLPCYGTFHWDGLCAKHTASCYLSVHCPQERAHALNGGWGTWDEELKKYRTVTPEEIREQVERGTAARWNSDKPHRCPACHAVTVPDPVSSWRVYTCCRCEQRFTRWPRLARLLPDVGVQCKEERHA